MFPRISEELEEDEEVELSRRLNAPLSRSPDNIIKRLGKKGRQFWVTKQIADSDQHDLEYNVKVHYAEFIIYLVFLACIIAVALKTDVVSEYHFNRAIRDNFIDRKFHKRDRSVKTFKEITDPDEVGDYIRPLFQGLLIWRAQKAHFYFGHVNSTFHQENQLVGAVRLRKVAIQENCDTHKYFKHYELPCYGYYSSSDQLKTTDSPNLFNWTDGGSTPSYYGKITNYGGSGLSFLMNNDEDLHAFYSFLSKYSWFDRATRAFFIEFTLYNVNLNLFCSVKLVLECPPSGGLVTSWLFRPVDLFQYHNWSDNFYFGLELVLYLFVVYYIIEEILELNFYRGRYFAQFWNVIDLAIIFAFLILLGVNVYRWVIVGEIVEKIEQRSLEFIHVDFASVLWRNTIYCWAMIASLSIIKLFKYLLITEGMRQFHLTMSLAARDLLGFLFMFFVAFFGFAQAAWVLFGHRLEDFHTWDLSMLTLLRMTTGDVNYQQLHDTNAFTAPIFFLAFVFMVVFIFLNMFIVIIMTIYSNVCAETSTGITEALTQFIQRGLWRIFTGWGLFKTIRHWKKPRMTFMPVQQLLYHAGYTMKEINIFFAKFDIDPNSHISKQEVYRVLKSLESKKFVPVHTSSNIFVGTDIVNDIRNEAVKYLTGTSMAEKFGVIGLEEYKLLQNTLDELEIETEMLTERMNRILNIFKKAQERGLIE